MKFIFWEDMLSIHQSAFIRALADFPYHQVMIVVTNELHNDRAKLGWNIPDLGQAEVILHPSPAQAKRIITQNVSDAAHIFYGVNSDKLVRNAYCQADHAGCLVGLMAERSYGYPRIKEPFQWIRDFWDSHTIFRHSAYYYAISTWAVNSYRRAGYRASIVYPFTYVVEKLETDFEIPVNLYPHRPEAVQIAYIGQGTRRKGLDILLKALARIRSANWELHIVGTIVEEYQELAHRLGIDSQIRFHGVVKNEIVRQMLSYMDLLVLPSRYDGWGAVLNEALMAGVPAICSDRCGAKDLLLDSWRGDVFSAGSISGLTTCLKTRIEEGKLALERREQIRDWTKCITGESVACYFSRVMEHVRGETSERPYPPWLE